NRGDVGGTELLVIGAPTISESSSPALNAKSWAERGERKIIVIKQIQTTMLITNFHGDSPCPQNSRLIRIENSFQNGFTLPLKNPE
ncbi:hypothetical protein ACULML_00060, partial [Xanthomonas arboricola pv. corylina]|uniref:hypothetical protein n=1 Tax=Xanthomonas arboricola TaxID=56448 RepID=UPI0040406F74